MPPDGRTGVRRHFVKVLTYSAKLRLKKGLWIAGIVLAALLVLFVGRIIYLQRYVVYDENGVHLDYSGEVSAGKDKTETVPTGEFILEQESAAGESIEAPTEGRLPALSGLYFTASQLMDETTHNVIPASLDNVNALMLDMKTATGRYLYATALDGTEKADVDLTPLITELAKRPNLTLIAKIPAFRDSAHALTDFSQALPIAGGALWMDHSGSYWLDPAGADVPGYLVAQARELFSMGFDEIVFDDFTFPSSTNIRYGRSIPGTEATFLAAQTISEQMSLQEIPVSFITEDTDILALSSRAFISAETGDLVSELVRQYADIFTQSDSQLVFLTTSRDTRFETYSVLSPYAAEE